MALTTYLNRPAVVILAGLFSLAGYAYLGYELERSSFILLFGQVCALFLFAYLLIEKSKINFWKLASLGLLFRLLLLLVIPNLSQDFYRFIWDGRLVLAGLNPYDFTVFEVLTGQYISIIQDPVQIADAELLYYGMGDLNASNYSNYPPLNQFLFTLSAFVGGKSISATVVAIRIILILADLGILWIGKKLLQKLKLPQKQIFWYFLNPFIIVELTGNLHFEGVMLFFLLCGLYLFLREQYVLAAVLIGMSVSVKLIPLMLLPLFFRYVLPRHNLLNGLKKIGEFYAITLIMVALSFLPFISVDLLANFSKSIGLWFQSFEFNASVYYIIRWIGFETIGWNIIADVGKVLPLIIIAFLIVMGLLRRINNAVDLLSGLLLGVSFYFLLSTTVHPWYVATPLLLSLFTRYRFAMVWSLLIFLSYSAYRKDGFSENLYLVATEYVIVLGVFFWDLRRIGFKASLEKTPPAL